MQHINSNGNTSPDELEYDEVLEQIGYGKTQWILLIVSGLLTITSVGAQQCMGIVVLASHCEFQTSLSEKGVMMAACVAGIFLSTYVCGYISDTIGRRKVLLYSIFICNALQFILMFVTSVWLFNIINFLCGISLGGVNGGLYAYLSEFNIPRHRAVTINYSTMFVSVTAIYVPAISWWILSSDWSVELLGGFVFRPWRLIILCTLLPGFIGGVVVLFYPESPKLLLSINKDREAVDAVDWISKFNRGLPINNVLNRYDFTLKPEIESNQNGELANQKGCNVLMNIGRATRPLFQKPHGLNFVLCTFAIFCMFFSSNGMQLWFPEIVNRTSSAGSNSSFTVCQVLDNSFKDSDGNKTMSASIDCSNPIADSTYIDNMIVGVAFLIGFSVQGALLNPFGRKNVLITALVLSVLSGILLHIVSNTTAVLVLFCLYILLPGLSISIMLGAIVDLVPTHLRGKAVSLSMSLGRLGIIAATNLIGIMLKPFCNTTFGLFTFILVVCIITVYRLPIKNSA